MIGIYMSGIAALLMVAAGAHAVMKQRTAANVALLITLLLLAGDALFDQLSLLPSVDFSRLREGALGMEALLPGAFLFLALAYGRTAPLRDLPKLRLVFMTIVALFPLVLLAVAGDDLYYSPDFQSDQALFVGSAGYWYCLGIMLSFILALVQIEATLVSTRGLTRVQMKFEAFGIMSLLAVLIFYYSQGLIYRTISMNLLPVRSSVYIIAALLIGYSHAFRGIAPRVTVSRHILYRSITLLAVGVYLISIGLFREGMQYFGVDFGKNLTIIIAFIGGILLIAVFFSERVQKRATVYIRKHFYANKHDYREEWLRFTDRLSSCGSLADVKEAVLAAYTETFGIAAASLYLLGRDGKRYIRAAGRDMPLEPADLNISEELKAYFVERERVLDLSDGEFLLSAGEVAIFRQARALMVVPLVRSGIIEGLIMLREQVVPQKLIHEDYDLMKVMARQAAQAIANSRLGEEIQEMRAMAAVSRISSFVIHDLKNLTTGLSLVVSNAEEHIGNLDFQKDAIRTVGGTLEKMKNLMQRLKAIPEKAELDVRVEDVDRLSRDAVGEAAVGKLGLRVSYEGIPVFSRVDREEMSKVIVNLVRNALEAGGDEGAVRIVTGRENGNVCIRVSDSGRGMSEDFLNNHLFKPFRTTKRNGLGIGLYQSRQIVESHGGRIAVTSTEGKGSVFTVYLPDAGDAGGAQS